MAIEGVLFDMDGVLVDSEPLHLEVERAIFEELGIGISEEEHYAYVGMAPLEVWKSIRRRYDLKTPAETLYRREQNRKLTLFEQREIPLVEGVFPLLQRLYEKGYPIALASSSPRRIIDLFVEKTGVGDFFRFLISAEEVERGKPAPDIFLAAAERLGCSPSDCLVIEDSANGVQAAKAAGMYCIGFQNSNSGYQDLSVADRVVESFSAEVRRTVLRWISEE